MNILHPLGGKHEANKTFILIFMILKNNLIKKVLGVLIVSLPEDLQFYLAHLVNILQELRELPNLLVYQ